MYRAERRHNAEFRLCAAALIFVTVVRRVFTPVVATKQTLDIMPRRYITFRVVGLWRLEGLTQWQWLLIGAYCALAADPLFSRSSRQFSQRGRTLLPSQAHLPVDHLFGPLPSPWWRLVSLRTVTFENKMLRTP